MDIDSFLVIYTQERALLDISERCQRKARVRRTYHVCLSCERRGRKSAPRLCSLTFRIVCQNCGDTPECIPSIDMVGRVVTVQSRQLYFAPCCASVQEYSGTGADFQAKHRPSQDIHDQDSPALPAPLCPHEIARGTPKSAAGLTRKPRSKCTAWNCQAHALPRPHHVLDHVECRMETYYLCHKHTPPEEWLRRAKNFAQFSEACRAWEIKAKNSHRKSCI